MTALHHIAEHIQLLLRQQSTVRLAFPGGRSALTLMDGLSNTAFDWASVQVTLVDERAVAATHEASNARLVCQTLLKNQACAATFEPLFDEDSVESSLQTLNAQRRPLDIVVLGMGHDGHFASLFPADEPVPGLLAGLDPFVGTRPIGSPCVRRLSMTLSTLLSASLVVLLVSSEAKRAKVNLGLTTIDPRNPISYLLASEHPIWVEWPDQSMSLIQQGVVQ